jgi:acetyl esterase
MPDARPASRGDLGAASSPAPVPTWRERLEGRLGRWVARLPGGVALRLVGERPLTIDGETLDPHTQVVLAARRHRPRPGMFEPTPPAARARYVREVLATQGARTPVAAVETVSVEGGEGPLPARLYRPAARGGETLPLLVFLHGGGFVVGDLETHDEPCRLLCRHAGTLVLSVAYRLAPEHPFPAAVDDAVAAVRWAHRHAESLGADRSRLGVGGDSAGANLATVAALALRGSADAVAAQLLIYPVTDMAAATPSRTRYATGFLLQGRDADQVVDLYLRAEAAAVADPRASPARTPSLAGAPPALVVLAGFDILRDEGAAYAQALRLAGVPVVEQRAPTLIHGFLHLTTVSPASRQALVTAAQAWGALVGAGRAAR